MFRLELEKDTTIERDTSNVELGSPVAAPAPRIRSSSPSPDKASMAPVRSSSPTPSPATTERPLSNPTAVRNSAPKALTLNRNRPSLSPKSDSGDGQDL